LSNDESPFSALWGMHTPVIGAINGACATGGLEIALACDFLIASERARFGDTHARVGFTPAGGMSVLLPEAVGLRAAREMSFTGNFVAAAEAHRLGLVNRVVARELVPVCVALGQRHGERRPGRSAGAEEPLRPRAPGSQGRSAEAELTCSQTGSSPRDDRVHNASLIDRNRGTPG
jgi:enoyl-CoA hydratase/carnithine racemase